MLTINEHIKNIALSYKGKREKPNNSGFEDAEFERRMAQIGWLKSQASAAWRRRRLAFDLFRSNGRKARHICSLR